MRKPVMMAAAMALIIFLPTLVWSAPMTIQFGIYADPARQVVAEEQAAQFMKKHPDIRVRVVAVPYSDYYKKLGVAMSTGDAWDLFMINGAYFSQVVPEGQLADLTDRIKRSGLALADYTIDPVNSEYNGRTYALPYELNMSAILYNQDLFDKAGVPYPTDDWTWDDLLDKAKKLTVRQGNRTVQWGFYSENHYASQLSFITQNGGAFLDESQSRSRISEPEAVEALQFMVDLVRKHGVSPASSELPPGINPFMTNRIAMVVGYSFSVLPTLEAPFRWGVAMWPTKKQHGNAYWTQGVGIYARSKHQDASWEFARYLMSAEAQTIMARERGATPSLKAVAKSSAYTGAPPAGMDVFVRSYEKGGAAVPFSPTFFQTFSGATASLTTAMSRAWSGSISVPEAAAQAAAEIDRIIAASK